MTSVMTINKTNDVWDNYHIINFKINVIPQLSIPERLYHFHITIEIEQFISSPNRLICNYWPKFDIVSYVIRLWKLHLRFWIWTHITG